MPDPERRTLSATETPALFNASPYVTRWLLWRKFKHGDQTEPDQTSRMYWGKELQPLLLKKAASDLKLEVHDNTADTYQRHSKLLIGCTRDALIYDPSRGWGSLEAKCCFDYGTWMREWGGGATIPRHYEIQLQHQMLVGDGFEPHTWGVLAVWVCGEMEYFERKPIDVFTAELTASVAQFFADIDFGAKGPEPFGTPVEYPLLAELFDPEPGATKFEPENYKLAEVARLYKSFSANRRFFEKGALASRLQLLTATESKYETLHLAGDIVVHVKKTKGGRINIKVDVPAELPDEIIADHPDAE
jgi:hypothetical protein